MGYSQTYKEEDCKDTCVTYDLQEAVFLSKSKALDLTGNHVQQLRYGYSCDRDAFQNLYELNEYAKIAETELNLFRAGLDTCLSDKELERLCSLIKTRAYRCGKYVEDYHVDTTGFEAWAALNPYCVGYEVWERCQYIIFDRLNLDFDIEELKCDLALDIVTEEISCELLLAIEAFQIRCDYDLAVNTTEIICDYNFDVNAELLICQQQLNVLLTEHHCDLSLETYVDLINCGLDFEFVCAVYENNCSLALESGSALLVCGQNKYDVRAFKIDEGMDISFLQ